MLSLYEATHLSLHGEDILDEAKLFTTKHLKSMVPRLSPPLALQVQRALIIPLHQGTERANARHYISIYQEDNSRNDVLLEFAKKDFNLLQLLHKKELMELFEWWERIIADVEPKLPFETRDRLAEFYTLVMGMNSEPHFSLGRIHITKLWTVLAIYDDAHDVHCNIAELRPLRDAFLRWDAEKTDELTEHIKIVFREMISVLKEVEVDMIRQRHFIGMPYLKKQFLRYAKSQFEEVTMLHLNDPPKLETWLQLSTITVAGHWSLVACVMNMGEIATEEVYNWIDSDPDGVVAAACLLCRLLDDIGTYEVEKDRGLTVSNISCYMKEYGVSEQEAVRGLWKMMESSWKDLNKKFFRPTPVPRPILKLILGFVRTSAEFIVYGDGDGITVSKGHARELVASLVRDSIPY